MAAFSSSEEEEEAEDEDEDLEVDLERGLDFDFDFDLDSADIEVWAIPSREEGNINYIIINFVPLKSESHVESGNPRIEQKKGSKKSPEKISAKFQNSP